MSKTNYFIALMLLGLCIFGVFQVKFTVQYLHREMVELQQQLTHEKETIHVLKAEWAYLNQPERLQRLAEKFLDLAEVKHDQLMLAQEGSIIIAATPIQPLIETQHNEQLVKVSYETKSSKPISKIKWRYRERPVMGAGRKK